MKRILLSITLLIAALCVSLSAKAQESKPFVARDEIRVSAGFGTLQELFGLLDYGLDPNSRFDDKYSGPLMSVPSINITYAKQFCSWFNFGVTASYSHTWRNEYNLYTDAKIASKNLFCAAITPEARFDWARMKYVRFYSKLSLGLAYYGDVSRAGTETYDNSVVIPSWDIVLVGICVGRDLYAFSESGFGVMGLFKLGVGYKF